MEVKKCIKCQVEKPLTEFFRQHTRKDGRQSSCKCCATANWKLWRLANLQKYTEWGKAHYQKHREESRQYSKAYYIKNKEKIKRQTGEYQVKHRDKVAIYSQKRYEAERGLRADLTVEQWEIIKSVFQQKCAYCGKRTKRLEREHIIPLSLGGALTLRNIVPACRSCNSKKSANLPEIPVKILLF